MNRASARVLAIAVAIGSGGAACAQSVPQSATIAVTASVDRKCTLANPQIDLGQTTNIGQVSGSTVRIADLSDDQMSTKVTDFTAEVAGMCNASHQLTVSSDRGGLWRDPAGLRSNGFANGVPYRATISWGGEQAILRANASGEGQVQQTLSVDQPAGGSVQIQFHIDQSATNVGVGAPLIAGTYDDTIRVTMGPL